MAMANDFVAGLEDVLDDPEVLAELDLQDLELGTVSDLDEGEIIGADGGGMSSCSRMSLSCRSVGRLRTMPMAPSSLCARM